MASDAGMEHGEAAGGPAAQQAAGTQAPSGAPPKKPTWGDFFSSPWFLILVLVWVWVLWSMRKQKRRERDRKNELSALKKGDRIVTVGRLHGVVVSLTEDTMTIKPDDKSNATLTFDRAALLKKETPGEKKNDKEAGAASK